MEFKGTKENWVIGEIDKNDCRITVNGSNIDVWSLDTTHDEMVANAKLIAAAPELLKLALLINRITSRKSMPTEMEVLVMQEQSEKAINKALK